MNHPDFARTHAHLNTELQRCLESLLSGECDEVEFVDAVRGKCSENEFIDAIAVQLRAVPASKPQVMAVINRLRNRGDVPLDLVRVLESKIAADPSRNGDTTVNLRPKGAVIAARVALDGPPPSPVEIGQVLRNRYVIEQRLGSGGKGTVFKALDRYRSSLPVAQRYVALKILHPVADGRHEMVESLRRELYCAQMLSHRNVVNVFELDRDGDIDFFTMELLEGELLSSVMARFHERPMHRPHAWAIIRQIAAGLEYAHSREVVHADLKPQNIMITDSGEVRILDFGSSSVFGKHASNRRERNVRSATPAYASCEILEGREPDPRDDLYAFACISYELLTGLHPFQRRRANEARDLGIVANRPSDLRGRQWQTLAKGLCSHRGGRSISVSDWFNRLRPNSEEAQRLPSSRDIQPAHAGTSPPSSLKSIALLAILAATVAASLFVVRSGPSGKTGGEALASAAASVAPLGGPLASATANQAGNQAAVSSAPSSQAPTTQTPLFGSIRSDGNRARFPFSHPAAISASDYDVRPGERFAEIRVHRSSGLRDEVPFVWWTEAASAKPGIDYVPQTKVTQKFPKGKSSTSFFVKLLPKASRIRPEVFYVAIGDAPAGPSLGQIVHTAVWLPSNDIVDAARIPQTADAASAVFGTDVNAILQ
ncbi:MAG: serine/threonine protein kinase [Pseudomonadota bacterium]|nr:serine/threonine protein kinase [Pseudomonadota bacterium]